MGLSHSEKRNWLTWALLALFLSLLVIIVLLQRETKRENLLLTRNASDVTRITIEQKNKTPIVLEKEGDWWIVEPLRMPANDQRIIPLLTIYTNPDLGYPIDTVDLVNTGLEDPEVSLIFNDYRVSIGNQAIDASKLAQARTLTAQQLVQWPRDEPPVIHSQTSATITLAGVVSQWQLFNTDRYVAMVPKDSNYAFILPQSDVAWIKNDE